MLWMLAVVLATATDDASIGAMFIAFISLLGTIHSKWDARRAKRQADRVALRSKELEIQHEENKRKHDAELIELRSKNQSLTDSWKRTHEELAQCRRDHAESETKHRESEADRAELRRKIEKFEAFMQAREAREKPG